MRTDCVRYSEVLFIKKQVRWESGLFCSSSLVRCWRGLSFSV